MLGAADIAPGFTDPVFDSQAVFRTILHAMAHPGTVCEIPIALDPPPPLDSATGAACLALLDTETPLWLQTSMQGARDYLRFHCGCPIVDTPAAAHFAVIHAAEVMPPLSAFNAGTDEYPDRSTTLIVQVRELAERDGVTVRGPGIRDHAKLAARGLRAGFWDEWRDNARRFPCGVDLILVADTRVAALPRTARVEG